MTAQEQSETFNTARSRRPTGWVECSRRGPAQVVPRDRGRAGGQTTSPTLVELAELGPCDLMNNDYVATTHERWGSVFPAIPGSCSKR
jgi:hypothetical protein